MKVRASKSPWLRHLFLPNLTLFLDSRHFNQSEWERLEHFAPPFGFMELNHSCECGASAWGLVSASSGGGGLGGAALALPGSDRRAPLFQWCRRS